MRYTAEKLWLPSMGQNVSICSAPAPEVMQTQIVTLICASTMAPFVICGWADLPPTCKMHWESPWIKSLLEA